jgi:glycosyltransferase involved in cell wall biosynthesis
VIEHKFLSMIGRMLAEAPHFHWVVVGPAIPKELSGLIAGAWRGRVHWIRYEPDLTSLFGALDIYLNPFMQAGGAYAAVDALVAGLPVLVAAKADSDVAHMLGERFVQSDADAYAATLRQLIADPAARRSLATVTLADLQARRSSAAAANHLVETVAAIRAGNLETSWRSALR